jgi:tetratricopeptide (TPR) repeat protein
MAEGLEDLLRACAVRVMGGPMPGAGFFVAPGQVLTCVHVIGDSDTLTVRWERDGQRAVEVPVARRVAVLDGGGRPIPALARDYPDIAVLEVAGLDGHPCVSIDPEWPSQEDTFQVFGYPREGGSELLTPARLSYRGTKGTMPATFLDLASDRIKGGMSGAAVLNQRTGGVCGVLVASKGTACPDGALAIPWSAVDTELGAVLAANQAFHLADRRWHTAAAARRKHLRFRLPWVVDHFTGRDDLLARLDAALNQHQAGVITQAVSGLGGVGKTQLAAAYVARHHHEFDIAAWVRAEDGATADLADLAVAVALPVAGRTPPERASDVLAFLAGTERSWLLVLDNVPGPAALTELPTSGQGRVLLTSRHRGGYGAFGPELPVDVFDAETARDYLLARTGRTGEEAADAGAVAKALGFLPLALAHAGAYCAAGVGVPFSEYLELLEDLPSQDLFDTNPEIFYQHTVAATWNASITAAEQQAPLARQALAMAAFLAPEAIPRSLFSVLDEDSAAGRKRVADALAALHRYSLATVADHGVTVHRLLQKVIRDQLAGPEQADAARHALTAVEHAMPEDPDLPAQWSQWQELVPHVTALAAIDASATVDAQRLVRMVNRVCSYLFSAGSTLTAMDLATTATAVATTDLGPDHPDTLTVRAHLATSYESAGRTADAITIKEQVAADTKRTLGPDHPGTLTVRNNLAVSYWSAGRTADAITILEQVAADTERILGPDHPDTLGARANLATSYWSAGRTADAITIEEQVAADRARILGLDHPDTLTVRANLATSYESAGRTADAITIKEQVAADRARILGPNHPDTLTVRNNLAVSYWSAGRTGEAGTIQEQVVVDMERILGPDHPSTVTARRTLARWKAERDVEP